MRVAAMFAPVLLLAAAPAHTEPGRLISYQQMAGAPAGADAWRIRYETRDHRGRRVQSTGVVVAPRRQEGLPRDVVAWAHGTVGIVEACAPSRSAEAISGIPAIADMIARGWVVVATDYPGLGTPGPHGYLVGDAAAHAVLDSVRAARRIPAARAGTRLAIWGHSQGGHATLFAASRLASYAPEFQLAAAVAASPPTDLAGILDGMDPTARGLLSAYVVRSWSRTYAVPLSTIVDRRTEGIIGRATTGCVGGETGLDQLVRVVALKDRLGAVDLTAKPRWASLLARNSVTASFRNVPLMVVSATADKVVADPVTRRFVASARADGADVTFVPIQGGDHATTAIETAPRAVEWIAQRFGPRAVARPY